MLKEVLNTTELLNSKPFIENEVQFNLIHRIADDKNALILTSEDKNVIVARSNPKLPMWIWIDNKVNLDKIDSFLNEIDSKLSLEDKFDIVTTPKIGKLFTYKIDCTYKIFMELNSFECKKTIKPNKLNGIMDKPSLYDIEIIANYNKGFYKESLNQNVEYEQLLESAKRQVETNNLYCLKVNSKIVSIANIAHKSLRYARVNNVYTPPNQRSRGYASELMYYLCEIIIENGLTPNLYTDISNKTSNKVYRNIGFKECGKVTHYIINRN